jgi:sulfate adenylyltransferase
MIMGHSEAITRAAGLPPVQLSDRALQDFELLTTGAFAPLDRFMGRRDYERVVAEMRLADGTLWPMPIVLRAPAAAAALAGREIALRTPRNDIVATMMIAEAFAADPRPELDAVLGTVDARHPLVAESASWGPVCLSGPITVLNPPVHYDFRDLRRTPAEVRRALSAFGRAHVVAFQTRNPMHRSHEELTKRAAEACDGALLIHPVVGLTQPGDVEHYARVRGYRALVDRYYEGYDVLLSVIPLAMRMAGPREALWHALIRRQYGATHFIVGRHHASPSVTIDGRPLYGPYAAQELCLKHADEIGITILPFEELVYLPDEHRYESTSRVKAGVRTETISGTEVRELLVRGRALPEWFTRPEVAETLTAAAGTGGFCVWFTGLPASGKSTTAEALVALLLERGRQVTLLDGDVVRTLLSKGLGFSKEDRDTNIRRIGYIASEIVRHGGAVVCAAISPYRATRDECRRLIGADRFVEVFMATPIGVCENRDPKGLYARALRGEITGVTGVDDPYEPPLSAEITMSAEHDDPLALSREVLQVLQQRGLVGAETQRRASVP